MRKGDPSDLDPAVAATVFDIDELRVARVYAEALLQAAEKVNKVDLIWEQLLGLVGTPLRRSRKLMRTAPRGCRRSGRSGPRRRGG